MAHRFTFRAWDKRKKHMAHDRFALIGETTMFDLLEQYSIDALNDLVMMQSTGLTDKNGKEIFEGDVVRTLTKPLPENSLDIVVEYKIEKSPVGYYGKYIHRSNGGLTYCQINDTIILSEIIGNLYESPELLEQS